MSDFFRHLFSTDFMPHGFCYRWAPDVLWLNAISDGVITLSYYLIPLALVTFGRKRRDVPFHWVFVMFGIFIFGCGTTHLMEIWTIWHATYRLAGMFKAITAAASAATAVLLVPLIPKAVALPSPAQLRTANTKLEEEIQERRRLERAMLDVSTREQQRIGQDLHDDLGQRLTGIAFLSKILEDRLTNGENPPPEDAARIVMLINETIQRTRDLARGMAPVFDSTDGLALALARRTEEISKNLQLDCRFDCAVPVPVRSLEIAHHLYYIAQEAANNALRHSGARVITVGLSARNATGKLVITDDGKGFDPRELHGSGFGMYTMENRAKIIGGALEIRSEAGRGTTVSCTFPAGED